jgi:hypothetical protein
MAWIQNLQQPFSGFTVEPDMDNIGSAWTLTRLRAINTTGRTVRVRFFDQIFESVTYPMYEFEIDPATKMPKIDPTTQKPFPPVYKGESPPELVYRGDVTLWETDFANGSTRQNSVRDVPAGILKASPVLNDAGAPIAGQFSIDTGFTFVRL